MPPYHPRATLPGTKCRQELLAVSLTHAWH